MFRDEIAGRWRAGESDHPARVSFAAAAVGALMRLERLDARYM